MRVTRDPRQIRVLGMARLGIEAVAMRARDRRHARTEASDHDGRRRVGAQIAGGPVEAIMRTQEARGVARPEATQDLGGFSHALRPDAIALDRQAERLLLPRIGRLRAATGAEAKDEAPARDLLEGRCHVGEKTWVPAGHVQHERPEGHALGHLGQGRERGQALGDAGRVAVGIAQMVPGPETVEAGLLGGHGRRAHLDPARAHGDKKEVRLHRGEYSPARTCYTTRVSAALEQEGARP